MRYGALVIWPTRDRIEGAASGESDLPVSKYNRHVLTDGGDSLEHRLHRQACPAVRSRALRFALPHPAASCQPDNEEKEPQCKVREGKTDPKFLPGSNLDEGAQARDGAWGRMLQGGRGST
jgi:hypothetical protein